MLLEDLLEHFHLTQHGFSRWQAKCPAHEDTRASLSLSDGEDRLLLYCQAMCRTEDVVKEAGLKMRDLFYDDIPGRRKEMEAEASYIYTDEEGNYLYEVVRFPGKRMAVRTESGWGVDGVRRVLYRLPEIANAGRHGTVYIVEGEKDVEALSVDHLATCPPFGAGKWRASYVKYFLNMHVKIVADRDEAGYKHAEEIRESLEGIARSVKVVQAKVGKDVSDHLEAGYSLEELEPVNAMV